MKEILEPLLKALEQAKLRAVVVRPDGTASEGYMFGFSQGKYAGLQEALNLVEHVFDDQDEQESKR